MTTVVNTLEKRKTNKNYLEGIENGVRWQKLSL